MPYIYMEPEIVWFCKEFNIYKTYDNDDYECPFGYWFTLDADTCGKENHYEFDIRDFEEYDDYLCIEENFDILVQKGYITKDGWRYKLTDKLNTHYLQEE